jgi:hypothetical protein
MSLSLAEALEQVDLQPGRTYRASVKRWTVEVRVLGDGPTPTLAEQVMLQPWTWFPDAPGGKIVQATPGPITLPDMPLLPPDLEEA